MSSHPIFLGISFEFSLAGEILSDGKYLSRFLPYGVWTPIVFVYGREHESQTQ